LRFNGAAKGRAARHIQYFCNRFAFAARVERCFGPAPAAQNRDAALPHAGVRTASALRRSVRGGMQKNSGMAE